MHHNSVYSGCQDNRDTDLDQTLFRLFLRLLTVTVPAHRGPIEYIEGEKHRSI